MSNGWIKLHRKITEWGWYKDANTSRLFLHLLLCAAHRDHVYRGVHIQRGQVLTGRKVLSEQLTMSPREIRTAINRLKTTSEVTLKTTNKYSLITIVNWDRYQCETITSDQQNDQQTVQRATSKRPANDQQTTTIKNGKNVQNEENGKKTRNKQSSPSGDGRFDDFWALYPRRVGKGHARKAWATATRTTDADTIIAGLRVQEPILRAKQPEYIPHPSTWLNGQRWADEAPQEQPGKSGWVEYLPTDGDPYAM